MDILNPRSLREEATRALIRGREPKKLILAFAGISTFLSLALTLGDLWLENQISGTGGLGNLGTRAVFSTVQMLFPVICTILTMCAEFGYLSGMMRVARGQYADHTDLKTGFEKIWPLLRLTILQYLVILAVGILSFQVGSIVLSLTPWAGPMLELMASVSTMDPSAIDETVFHALMQVAIPMYVILIILFLIALVPVLFRLRMAMFCLLDDPNGRALAAIRSSSKMMRRKFLPMLKVDLSLWVYYVLIALTPVVIYSDLILSLMGIALPLDPLVLSLLVYGLGLGANFLVQVALRNRVEITYLIAYDRLREKPKDSGPVVLGSIFDM